MPRQDIASHRGVPDGREEILAITFGANKLGDPHTVLQEVLRDIVHQRRVRGCDDAGKTDQPFEDLCRPHQEAITKILRTVFSVFQVPVKPGFMTKLSPAPKTCVSPPFSAISQRPARIWQNAPPCPATVTESARGAADRAAARATNEMSCAQTGKRGRRCRDGQAKMQASRTPETDMTFRPSFITFD